MRSSAAVKRRNPPYLFDFYNIFGYFQNKYSNVPGLARVINSFTEALNNRMKLPKYAVFILDRDFMELTIRDKPKLYPIFEKTTLYLIRQIEMNVTRRTQELFSKKPGALMLDSPPIVWVKMLKRPADLNLFEETEITENRGSTLRSKFNKALVDTLCSLNSRIQHLILSIEVDSNEFDLLGNLTLGGKEQYWHE